MSGLAEAAGLRLLVAHLALGIWLGLTQPPTALAQALVQPSNYAALTGKKAMAVVPGNANHHGVAYGQEDDLSAAHGALNNCQAAWSTPCEIVWLNHEAVTSGASIREQAGSAAHPLFLWQYTSPTATVYLVGSIHLLKPSLYPLPRQLHDSFNAADYLVLEVDSEALNPLTIQQLTARYGVLPGTQSLTDVLPPGLYQRLSTSLANYGVDITGLARFKPALVMTELVRLRLAALGYVADHGVEAYFRSRIKHQQVLQLETMELQMQLLFDQPLGTQLQLLADTLDQEMLIEPLLADLIVAWLGGDDQAFLRLFQQQSGDSAVAQTFTRQLLDERNVGMARRVQQYLGSSGTYFVLAGAAHFIGQNGIVELLNRKNIRGTRISSTTDLSTYRQTTAPPAQVVSGN